MRDNALEPKAPIQWRFAPCAECPKQHSLLRIEHAGLLKLQQVAFDAVGVLVDVFKKQHAAVDARKVFRPKQ